MRKKRLDVVNPVEGKKPSKFVRSLKRIDVVNLFIHLFYVVISLAILYPFISMLSVSLLSEKELLQEGYSIWPKNPTGDAYAAVFKNFKPIAEALITSLMVCVATTLLTVMLNAMYAYAVSRPTFSARRIINFILLFTMFFGGGASASYIVNVSWLNLKNNLLILIVPGTMGAMSVIIIRSFFQGLPYGLVESAKLDGASEYQIFFKIMLPLSTPALGTIAISAFIGSWNAYYAPMMYFDYGKATTLSLYLQRLLDHMEQYKQSAVLSGSLAEVPSASMAMAVACITVLPMVMIFPWFQKYFVKGMAIGAVKA
jgi:putative aldouronate transport system permease protein